MGIEISANRGRPPNEAAEANKAQSTQQTAQQPRAGGGAKPGSSGGDDVKLSSQAAQLHALEAEISTLPVVDTQRVGEVQHALATGSFEIQPAQVADKMLSFEAGLGKG
jgi:negative regulator of flagellin synthesis FlgM